MTIAINIDVNTLVGQKKLQKLIRAIGADQLLDAVGQRVLRWVNQNFEQEGGKDGTKKWRQLSPVTLGRRRAGKGVGSAKILQDTGNLKRSFDYEIKTNQEAVTVGTRVKYAPTHQRGAKRGAYGASRHGSPIPWGDVPSRPMLPTKAVAAGLARGIIQAALNRSIEK